MHPQNKPDDVIIGTCAAAAALLCAAKAHLHSSCTLPKKAPLLDACHELQRVWFGPCQAHAPTQPLHSLPAGYHCRARKDIKSCQYTPWHMRPSDCPNKFWGESVPREHRHGVGCDGTTAQRQRRHQHFATLPHGGYKYPKLPAWAAQLQMGSSWPCSCPSLRVCCCRA